eukprot:TRINITY_DN497_c0_g1_i2.p2 TRINITY_DN497_c0_g1~~TRINITY_DN497_c0_g1_i2.p2  ORF type:complete len:52 (-),score=2.36 TRINITY_DN497_c0_g1_i2:182-337(-)
MKVCETPPMQYCSILTALLVHPSPPPFPTQSHFSKREEKKPEKKKNTTVRP